MCFYALQFRSFMSKCRKPYKQPHVRRASTTKNRPPRLKIIMLSGLWLNLLLNLIFFNHAYTHHCFTHCSHRNTAWCFQYSCRCASLSLLPYSVFMSTFKCAFKQQLETKRVPHTAFLYNSYILKMKSKHRI